MNNSRLLFVLMFVSICIQVSFAAAIQARERSNVGRNMLAEILLSAAKKTVLAARSDIACPIGSIYDANTGLCITIMIHPAVQNVFGNGGLGDGNQDGNANGK